MPDVINIFTLKENENGLPCKRMVCVPCDMLKVIIN